MCHFNRKLSEFERIQEHRRSKEAELEEDRYSEIARREWERGIYHQCDEEDRRRMEEAMENDMRVAKAYSDTLNFVFDKLFGKVNHGQ